MKNKQAFTLIELLVVVLIIGILAAVALPQYQKAVTKSRFAEALANLKTIAQAHQVCSLEKGSFCTLDELSVEIGEYDGNYLHTQYFWYSTQNNSGPGWAIAQYDPEDVCLCYLQTGEIVVNQNEGSCGDDDASFDYAKLLHLREVPFEECACC